MHDTYSKEDVIRIIGEKNWDDFETYMLGETILFDESGLDSYFPRDVNVFCKLHNIV